MSNLSFFDKFKNFALSKPEIKKVSGGGRYCDALDYCRENAWVSAFETDNGHDTLDGAIGLYETLSSACTDTFQEGCYNELRNGDF